MTTEVPTELVREICTLAVIPEYSSYPIMEVAPPPPPLPSNANEFLSGTQVNVLLEIKTGEFQGARPVYEVGLVLDVSGSMAGGRLTSLKEAVIAVLSLLRDTDVVHIIAYNGEANLLATNAVLGEQRELLKRTVEDLCAGGGTNISDALALAKRQMMSGGRNFLRRIFLYSDGEPNEGLKEVDEFASFCHTLQMECNAQISTFGIGEGIDAAVMQCIAENGGGHYDFVTNQRIMELTQRALSGMDRLLGTRGEIRFTLPSGVGLRSIGGDEGEGEEGGVALSSTGERCIDLGNIKYSWSKRLLLRLRVQPGSGSFTLPVQLLYVPATDALAPMAVISAQGTINFVPPAQAFGSSDGSPRVRNRQVAMTMALNYVGTAFAQAATLLEQQQVPQAISVIREAVAELEQYKDDDPTGVVVETQLRRGNRTLQRLEMDGARGARRAELDLGHQAAMMQRDLSEDDFHSRGNVSEIFEPNDVTSPPRGHSPPPFNSGRRGSFGSIGSDDADDYFVAAMSSPTLGGQPPRNHTPPPLDVPSTADEVEDVPEEYFCPLTKAIMRDPVCTTDGQSYDREAIESWFATGKTTSPATGAQLSSLQLFPNFALRKLIESFLRKHSGAQGSASPSTPDGRSGSGSP
jgi:uncharacterized protein YegL